MEFIIELLAELLLEGTFELSQTKKTPKWLRYPLIGIVLFIFLGVTAIIFITGFLALKEMPIVGIILLIAGIFFVIYCLRHFKNIYVKRDPNSKDSKIWEKFIEQICPKKLKDLTEIQKNAVLCFYYDREMNIGGHVCYFDNYSKVKNEDLINALKIVSNKKFVENFEEAIATGKEDNYEKTDAMYQKLSPCLTEYLEEYVLKNKDVILEEKKEIF